jgi:glycerophosphoryl diester phosphodiesterase
MPQGNRLTIWLLLCIALTLASRSEGATDSTANEFNALRIAHAGGIYKGLTYTNSYEALDTNLKAGFRYFELDFLFTKDGKLICLHDWNENFKRTFGKTTDEPLSHEEFKELVDKNNKFTNCTLTGLAQWMNKNPEAVIITDIRGNVRKALSKIARRLPEAHRRVIPQIYDAKQYLWIEELGFDSVIWTLYRTTDSTRSVLYQTSRWNLPFAVAMPQSRVESGLPEQLNELGIPSYVHTINRRKQWKYLQTKGVTEIYTDRLAPGNP